MSNQAQLQIRILETLAAPVVAAAAGAANPAQAVAEFLSIAAQQAASAAPLLAVPAADADAARLALAAVAARALTDPAKPDGARVGEALRSVLDGIDKLTSTAGRLDTLDAGIAHDPVQLALQRAAALAPVVAAIAAQGQADTGQAKVAADHIAARASAARQTLVPQLGDAEGAVAEVTLFRGLANLYAAVAKTGAPDAVASKFDQLADMLVTLAASLMPAGSSARAPAPVTAATAPAAPPAPSQPSPAAAPPAAGGNPMAFFKPGAKKPPVTEGGDGNAA